MSAFSRNVAANLAGTGWSALVQLAVVPLLVARLGVESYALVGFYAALLAALGILDLGLLPTLTRKMASVGKAGPGDRPGDVLCSFAWVFLGVGVAAGVCLAFSAGLIAEHWFRTVSLGRDEVQIAVQLMGVLFALKWIASPYAAVMQGLQQQVSLNVVNASMVTLANVGALLALSWFGQTIVVFLLWQCLAAALQLVWLRARAVGALPPQATPPRFDRHALLESWRFSAGVAGIALMGTVLAQSDKLLLSKLVSLDEYGYYSIAQVLVAGLQVITLPIFNAAMPRMCELAAAGDESGLRSFFQASSELMNALLVPAAAFMALFSHQIMLMWLGAGEAAVRAAPLLQLLAGGLLLNGLMNMPYALQLARGNTRLALAINGALCVLIVPAIFLLVGAYGLQGGAAVSVLMNGLYLAVGLPLTYRACLRSGGSARFYLRLLSQQGVALVILVAAWLWLPVSLPAWATAVVLALALTFAMLASLAFTPSARALLGELLGLHPTGGARGA